MIGQTLSHYRILEQIGAGGMGVVYRAHDEQLDRDVAIKVLPTGSLADETAQKRFRKEAQSLARLNHPNVATVHEFGHQDGMDFLVTEYIAGITLDKKLAHGPLPAEEVVGLGLQIAAGLAAAHREGVVHRDLKPANLRITPDGRLKILDFGLAQFTARASELGLTATLTQPQGNTSGTLPYMSPEQLSGKPTDQRTDIWGAGAVLYEIATGKRPFPQLLPALVIDAILNRPPDSLADRAPELPLHVRRAIMRALSRDPADRQHSAEELAADLTVPARASAEPGGRRPLIAAAVAVLVLACATGGYLVLHRPHQTASGARRPSVAVLGFKNLSDSADKSWLSTALSEMLTTELSQGDQLRTVPGESVTQMMTSLSLPEGDSFSRPTLLRIRQNLAADHVVIGSYVPLGNGMLRLDVRLQSTSAGETLVSVSEKGSEAEIDSLVTRAGSELRAKLGVAALSDAQAAMVRSSLPANPDAARFYSEGLRKLRLFDAMPARDLLEKAAMLSPEHAPTHSALAEAWSAIGYEARAREEAKRASDLSANFSREERLLIEGRAHELMGEPSQAIESYRTLLNLFPDRVDYGLLLIRAQIAGGHGRDAETALAALRQLSLSDAEIARTDLAEANIAISLSDFKRSLAAAERAANRGRSIGASLLVAESLRFGADAAERMGQTEKTIQLLSEAKTLYTANGHRQGAARTLLATGDLLTDQGKYEEAKRPYKDALAVFRETGNRRRIRDTLERIGNVIYQQGKLRESEDFYNQALEVDRDFNDPRGLASDYGNLANAMDGLGDLAGALKMQRQALDAFTSNGDRRGVSATLNNLGNLSVERGELEEAKKYFDQALALSREISFRRGEPYPISGLGDVFFARGQVQEARTQYEQAIALCAEVQDEDFPEQIRTAMASIALHEKRLSDGEPLARQAAAYFDKVNAPASGAMARSILARILLAQGKRDEAQREVEKASSLAKQTTGQTPGYEVVLAKSRVKARSGKSAEARKELLQSLGSARKFGYRLYEYQIRLALAEISSWSRFPQSAELRALEAESSAHGALLFAMQAKALRSR